MMHSLAQRTSSWTSVITSALFTVAILVSILTYLTNTSDDSSFLIKNVKALVSVKNTRNFGGSREKPKENAKFKFDLIADFSALVDWNTKQIFTYVFVEFDDGYDNINESKLIIWDRILTDKNNVYINTKNIKSKYSIWDYTKTLQGRTGQLKLGYNIQPYIGPLTFREVDLNQNITFQLPKENSQ